MGTHETLLAYLVRRLLENGANTSFVHRIADTTLPLDELVRDPVEQVEALARAEGGIGLPHPAIPLPRELYGALRINSRGLDLASEQELGELDAMLRETAAVQWTAGPLLAQETPGSLREPGLRETVNTVDRGERAAEPRQPVTNPAERSDIVGHVQDASIEDVDFALAHATERAAEWAAVPPAERARMLRDAASRLEQDMPRLLGLLIREAGKTAANAIAEVREAVDFLRYYAAQVEADFDNRTHRPLGPVVCISPWNFPLAIFTGQVAAALAAGNTVLAKPAEQTPLIAAQAVHALWAAGVPRFAPCSCCRGAARSSARASWATSACKACSSPVPPRSGAPARSAAWPAAPTTAGAPFPLVAETGGQNAMIVDSSALPEQVVTDVLVSAFDSAGQRCSALRVLFVQEDAADPLAGNAAGRHGRTARGPARQAGHR